MRKYEAIVFDMDGTLLDTLEDLTDATNYALGEMGMPKRTIAEVRTFVGNGVGKLIERAIPDGLANPQFEETFTKFKEYYSVHSNDKTRPYEGVVLLLRELAAEGYGLAIVSNKLDTAVKELAEHFFEGIVPVVIGEREGVARKPKPDMVYEALRELGVSAEAAVFVGDSEVDFLTAKNAGLPCISVLWGFRDEEFLRAQGAVNFARIPQEIKNFI